MLAHLHRCQLLTQPNLGEGGVARKVLQDRCRPSWQSPRGLRNALTERGRLHEIAVDDPGHPVEEVGPVRGAMGGEDVFLISVRDVVANSSLRLPKRPGELILFFNGAPLKNVTVLNDNTPISHPPSKYLALDGASSCEQRRHKAFPRPREPQKQKGHDY